MQPTRHIRLGLSWCVLMNVLLLGFVESAAAAEVVEVRVGRHPTFTRIVFEMDSPAGYRIERRSDATGDATSLIVTMEARSKPLSVSSGSSLVESVTVGEELGRAVARIRLKKPRLAVKEMILANPPRIVLDVMGPSEPVKTSRATAPGKQPIYVADTKAKTDAGTTLASRTSAPTQAPAVRAEARDTASKESKKPTPAPTLAVKKPAPTATKPAQAKTEQPSRQVAQLKPSAQPNPRDRGAESSAVNLVGKDESAAAAKTAATSASTAAKTAASAPKRKPVSVVTTGKTDEKGLLDSLPVDGGTLAGIVGALAVAIVGFVFVRRKKNAAPKQGGSASDDLFPALRDDSFPEMGGQDAFGESFNDPGIATAEAEASEPDDGGFGFGAPDQAMETESGGPAGGGMPLAGPGGGLFDDEKKESSMEQLNTPTTGMDRGAPLGGAGGDAVADLERRLAQVEARLEETVESCERLERQVAAQSEELRVQRAAIARTQRALRSLSRSEEEQATEPALREPLA